MTKTAFNLIDDGWIPVQGESSLQSLRDIFSRRELKRLGGDPVEKIVLLRLLLAIAHAAVELPDRTAWLALTPELLAEKASVYLEQWRDRFSLYGDKPFLQFPALAAGKVSPISATQVSVSSGNKVVLTSWNIPRDYDDAFRARTLLRQSCFGCSGKRYDQEIVLAPGMTKNPTGKSGTLAGFQGYLHSYMLGESILETVHYNLLTADEIAACGVFSAGIGRPFWEHMPENENCPQARELLATYQGQLLPMDKFLLLTGDGIVMTDGIAYPSHKTGLADPALTLWGAPPNVKALWCSTEKRPWRDLVALLGFLDVSQGRKTPWLLSCGREKLIRARVPIMAVWTGGFRVSSNAGEQYLSGTDDYLESEFHIPAENCSEEYFPRYQQMIDTLESYAKILYAAINGYFKEQQSLLGADVAPAAVRKFWELMEPRHQTIIDIAFADAAAPETIAAEQKLWQNTVSQIYHETCPNVTARQLTAWAKCTPVFTSGKSKKEKKDAN